MPRHNPRQEALGQQMSFCAKA